MSPGLDRWGRSESSGSLERLVGVAYDRWFRVEWEGLANIPRSGGALLVANHAGAIPVDGVLVQHGIARELGRRVVGLAHHLFWRVPFLGTAMSRAGAAVAHPGNADRLLREEGRLVLVFPEGAKGVQKTIDERYRLQRFGRGGFVETALRAGVPIVPIALLGTEETMPTLAMIPGPSGLAVPITLNALLLGPLGFVHFPAKVRVRVLPPLDPIAPARLRNYPRSIVMDTAEEVRMRLQRAIDEMLAARTSVFGG